MLSNRNFDANGVLKSWYLGFCNIAKLPATFGDILCTGNLHLSRNQLQCLPLRFSNLSVGGDLHLYYHQLRSLPPNFEQIRVGGDLYLHNNPELTASQRYSSSVSKCEGQGLPVGSFP